MSEPDKSWRTVLFIRHGATLLNHNDSLKDRIRGWTDLPLSDEGKAEIQRMADDVFEFDSLLSSDLCRAVQTAEIISRKVGRPLQPPDKAFRPWNVGEFAGKVAAEAAPDLARYATKLPHEGLPGGESFDAFRHRFLTGLHDALWRHDGLTAIVTHHRCIRLVKAWAKSGYPKDGAIDGEEFACKGETTGSIESIRIPLAVLTAVLRSSLVMMHLSRRDYVGSG